MEAKLSALREGAHRALEETGINTLFATYGFLEWYEAAHSEKALYAPLLLQPLEIERVSQRGRWRYQIRATDEDTIINIALVERLKQDFALDLPRLGEDEAPEAYLARIEALIATRAPWRVRRFVTVGLFAFGRLAMWHDLDPTRWPKGTAPATNSVVAGLLAGGAGGEGVEAVEHDIDALMFTAKAPPLIRPADASQYSAIIDALEGKNLAIKGPPGTGKSQTIANLIAAAAFKGQRVLFIAEKMAALSVVKSRLDEAGLGNFVLELHSTRAKKKDVLAGLATRLQQQDRLQAPPRIDAERWEYARLQRQLSAYVMRLNTPFGATGKTVQEILWAAQRASGLDLPGALDRVILDGVDRLTLRDLERTGEVLRRFEAMIGEVGTRWGEPDRHPWSWVTRVLSRFEGEDLVASVREWRACLEELGDRGSAVAAVVPGIDVSTSAAMRRLAQALKALPMSVPVEVERSLFVQLASEGARRKLSAFLKAASERQRLLERCRGGVSVEAAAPRLRDLAVLPELITLLGADAQRASQAGTIVTESERAQGDWRAAREAIDALGGIFRATDVQSHPALRLLLDAVKLVENTSARALDRRRRSLADQEARGLLDRAARQVAELRDARRRLDTSHDVAAAGRPADLRRAARLLRETRFIGRFFGPYTNARGLWRTISRGQLKAARHVMANDLEAIAAHLESIASFSGDSSLQDLLGSDFRGMETDFEPFQQAAAFLIAARELGSSDPALGARLFRALADGERFVLDQIDAFARSGRCKHVEEAVVALEREGESSVDGMTARLDGRVKASHGLRAGLQEFLVSGEVELGKLEDVVRDLERVADLEADLRALSASAPLAGGSRLDFTLPTDSLEATLMFAEGLAAAASSAPDVVLRHVFAVDVDDRLRRLRAVAGGLELAVDKETKIRAEVLTLAGGSEQPLARAALADVAASLNTAIAHDDALGEWCGVLRLREAVVGEGALPVISAFVDIPLTQLPKAYTRVFWRSLARRVFDEHPELRSLSGTDQDMARRRFRSVDRQLHELNSREIAAKLCRAQAPGGVDRGPRSEWTELTLIRHQAELQRPRIAIRDLIRRAGRATQALKPCWMMSPISVAQFLEPGTVEFDLVVIDEASQMRPEEAIGALGRGRQVVVVGDPMQLPPTAFFDRMDAFDDDQQEEVDEESILDMALGAFQPYRHLRWHYRSRHESLIHFSNKEFYDGKLIVFPSPSGRQRDLGVRYHPVNGLYRGRGGNAEEVKAVALAVVEAMRRNPDRSLGVVAVNLEQAELLRMEIDRLVVRDPEAQQYVGRWEATLEPFFVKNLENVQGDERDVIMVSTVYGRNEHGKVMQRFGPINQKTGHRRLNVLFTRAKHRVDLFTSLTAADVRVDETSSWGVKTLKSYLEYAATGRAEGGRVKGREPDSDFEVLVAEALKARGYEVTPQVGVAGFYVDLAVRHQDYPHGFLAGIECDGAAYHSAKSARDRDVLRQEILENLGWHLYRVWSTDWFNNPGREVERLLAFLQERLRREG